MIYLLVLFFLFSCLPQKEAEIVYKNDEDAVENKYIPSYFKHNYQLNNDDIEKQEPVVENKIDSYEEVDVDDKGSMQVAVAKDDNESIERTVLVENGDSVLYFARKYNTSVELIAKLNNLKKPYNIYVGQKLKIKTNTNKTIKNDGEAGVNNIKTVVVKPDDNLLKIAVNNNMSLREVAELNNIESPYRIYVGQKIKVYANSKREIGKDLAKNNGQKSLEEVKNNKNISNKTSSGNYYTVESGDNIFYIAKKFSTTASKIIKLNDLKKPYNIYVGQKLMIEDIKDNNLSDSNVNMNNNTTNNKNVDDKTIKTVVEVNNSSSKLQNDNNFIMPVKGDIIKKFGQQYEGKSFDGILIKATKGTNILASEEGEVIYASNELKDLGNVIIIKHKNKWLSIYGHCNDIKVKVKNTVKQGEIIGTVGDTGKADEAQLYFAIRRVRTAVDPLIYINNSK